jgi:cell division protein ZapA
MAQVRVSIAGRSYDLACHPGEEQHLTMLAARVDAKAKAAADAGGGMTEVRQLLFAALLLADDIEQGSASQESNASADADPGVASALDQMALRLETLAGRLEKSGAAT